MRDAVEDLEQFLVPDFVVFDQIVGIYDFASRAFVDTAKGGGDIQVAVVVGQLFAGVNVPDGNFKVVGCGQAVGVEAVVDVAAVIPAEDQVSLVIAKRVGVQNILVDVFHRLEFERTELAVQFVQDPGDGSGRDEFGGDDAVADFVADKFQLGFGVYHFGSLIHKRKECGRR